VTQMPPVQPPPPPPWEPPGPETVALAPGPTGAPPWQTWPPPVARLIVPPPRRRLTWDHPGLLMAVVGVSLVLAIALGTPVILLKWRPGLFLVEVVAFLVPAWAYMRLLRGKWDDVFGLRPRTAVGLVVAVLLAAGVWFLSSVFLNAILQSIFTPETLRKMGETWNAVALCETSREWTWTLLGFVVAPAIAEEVLFRGVIQRGLERRWRRRPALLVTALIFAAIHLQPLTFPVLFVLGLEFGWLYQRTRSVWPGAVAHAVNNLLAILVLNAGRETDASPSSADVWGLIVVSVLVVVGALLVFGLVTRRPRPLPAAKGVVVPETSSGGPTRP